MNRLKALAAQGQSIWLDYIRRDLILSGELERLIREDGLSGMTSNPAIFEKAYASSPHYARAMRALLDRGDLDAQTLYETLAVRDIQDAADVLVQVFDETKGADGFVSLEVSPYLAHDTEGTIQEARRLRRLVGRPNVLIKIPATPEGIPAIRQATSEGISVNVTLLFAQKAYEEVAHAYLEGLEAYAATGGDLSRVASVASFFISRIDTLADSLLRKKIEAASPDERPRLSALLGRTAIANGRLTYQKFKSIFSGPRWQALGSKGARPQRVLWASTSTKNPAYRDVVYVEELIGADTVNTLPPQTWDAFKDHGEARPSLEEGVSEAAAMLQQLEAAGISLTQVTTQVLDEGVRLFADAFDALLGAVERKRREILADTLARQTLHFPEGLQKEHAATLDAWRAGGFGRRMFARDPALFTGHDEGRWMDWLDSPARLLSDPGPYRAVRSRVRDEGFHHALLLGMGGSSLGPEVLRQTFGKTDGWPELLVLDSTDPMQIRAIESRIDPRRTLFIVSSKSGSTLEPAILRDYFFDRARAVLGDAAVGRHFIAITDPGSQLQKASEAAGFRHIFAGVPGIGGRFSVLSPFGMVPAAIAGIDVEPFLQRTMAMVRSCSAAVPPIENPGIALGVALGLLARQGKNKVTIFASPGLGAISLWLEQLLAESTGKAGLGLIPIAGERPAAPDRYGSDRVFIDIRLARAHDAAQDRAVDALQAAGFPVVRILVPSIDDLGGEFYRFEIATTAACAVLGIDPFDQPDVEAAKVGARTLTTAFEASGSLPVEKPFVKEGGLALFADAAQTATLQKAAGDRGLAGCLGAHLAQIGEGGYFALLAFIEMSPAHQEILQALRHKVRDARKVATCLGFGPRFLHSTGQAHKGGPAGGVFLQVTCDDKKDLPVPGRRLSFGVVKAAQARGDFAVLAERGRPILRVHLGGDVKASLQALSAAVVKALG